MTVKCLKLLWYRFLSTKTWNCSEHLLSDFVLILQLALRATTSTSISPKVIFTSPEKKFTFQNVFKMFSRFIFFMFQKNKNVCFDHFWQLFIWQIFVKSENNTIWSTFYQQAPTVSVFSIYHIETHVTNICLKK